jgi:hypothetical protein
MRLDDDDAEQRKIAIRVRGHVKVRKARHMGREVFGTDDHRKVSARC